MPSLSSLTPALMQHPRWKGVTHTSFLPVGQGFLILQETPGRTRETQEGPLRQNWSLQGVSVKAGVCSSGQRGRASWAQLGIEGALTVWLPEPSLTAGPPLPVKFCSHILKAPTFNFLYMSLSSNINVLLLRLAEMLAFCVDRGPVWLHHSLSVHPRPLPLWPRQ